MTYTGTAVYDIYTNEIGEDVSAIVSLISPSATRFLDDIGDADTPIVSKYYTWEEKALLPDTFGASSAIGSTAAASNGIEFGANASLIRTKDIFRITWSGEQIMVTSLGASAATIYVTRAYAGTSANSMAAAATGIEFLGSAVEEGSGARTQRRRGKSLAGNFVQIFREDIDISNLANNAKLKAPGQPAPYDEEVADKTTEVLKQLERSVLMGRTNGNTIGADDAETTMAGLYYSIATNITSNATFTNSIINEMFKQVDRYTDLAGNIDKYGLYCGITAFRKISNSRDSRIDQMISETTAGVLPVESYFSDFGPVPVKYIRWIPTGSAVLVRKDFVKVRPFAGNSFASRRYDLGALSTTGYVAGCYGLEFHQETAHGRMDGL